MISESARVTTAAEARFRINAPNSRQRVIKIIALGHTSERLVKHLATREWNQATFLRLRRLTARRARRKSSRWPAG